MEIRCVSTAVVSSFQKDMDVRVSGSMLSIRQTTLDVKLFTRIRVTANDPGGLGAEMSFPIQTSLPKAILWTSSYAYGGSHSESMCSEYVIVDPDAYERERLRSGGLISSAYVRGFDTRCVTATCKIYLPSIDHRYGDLKCDYSLRYDTTICERSDGLNCRGSSVSRGGCHETFDWGIYTTYSDERWGLEVYEEYMKHCRSLGFHWSTQRPTQATDNRGGLIVWLKKWIIKHFECPRLAGPKSPQCCRRSPRLGPQRSRKGMSFKWYSCGGCRIRRHSHSLLATRRRQLVVKISNGLNGTNLKTTFGSRQATKTPTPVGRGPVVGLRTGGDGGGIVATQPVI